MALRRDDEQEFQQARYDGDEWLLRAACRGDDAAVFYPPPHFERKEVRLARERLAQSICRQCAVASECLGYALRTREPHGVWGGLNEFERRRLLQSDRGR